MVQRCLKDCLTELFGEDKSNMPLSGTRETANGHLRTDSIEDLKTKSVKAFKWSALGEITSRAIQPLVTTILASILTPADFGMVAVVTIVLSLCQLFQDFGLGKTLVQTEKNLTEYANNAFWLNLCAATFLYLVILLSAPLIGSVFRNSDSIPVLRMLSLQLILSSLTSVQAALFHRSVRFNLIFAVRLVSGLVPGLVSIPMALSGYGVWALVLGTLAGSAVQVILYWWFSDWKPQFTVHLSLVKRLIGFSKWVATEGLAGWLIAWGDSFLLGMYLGVSELGQYRVGTLFVVLLSNLFFTPFIPIAYSFFSRLQSEREQFKSYFLKLSKLITAIVLPIGLTAAFFAGPIINVVLGAKWQGTEIVLATMSVRWALGCLVGLNSTAYTSLGRPDVNVKFLGVVVLISLPVYFIAAPYGLLPFCIARLLTAQFDNILNYFVGVRVFRLRAGYMWDNLRLPFAPLMVMSAVILVFQKTFTVDNVATLIVGLLVAVFAYLLALYLFQRDFVRWSFKYAVAVVR